MFVTLFRYTPVSLFRGARWTPQSSLVGTAVELQPERFGSLGTLLLKDTKFGGSDTIKHYRPIRLIMSIGRSVVQDG